MIQTSPGEQYTATLVGAPANIQPPDLLCRVVNLATGVPSFPFAPEELYPGVYSVTRNSPSVPGNYVILWEYQGTTASEEIEVLSQPVEQRYDYYPDTVTLTSASSVEELLALDSDQQDALRVAAITAVEEFCGQSFENFSGVIEVEVDNGAEVWLPRRVRSLNAITPDGADPLDLDALAVTHNGQRLLWRTNYVGVGYYEQALYEVSGGDYPKQFREGLIAVDADWGWEFVPEPIVRALQWDMEETALADANALSSTVHVFRKLGLENVSQGNLRADLGAVASLSPRVRRLLEPYVFLGPGGRLV